MRIMFILCFLALVGFYGCKPLPNDGIPFYLKTDSVALYTTGDSQGVNTHNISDLWVEANATNLGVYEMPAWFPVLEENEVRMVISAGVKQSGQSGVRVVYPFYQTDTFTLNAKRGETFTHYPVFKYKTGTRFAFKCEDFSTGNDYTSAMSSTTFTDSIAQAPFPPCGVINIAATDSNKLASQNFTYSLPTGSEVWLEFDYKSDLPFWVGFYAKSSSTVMPNYVMLVTTKSSWNKLYVKLTESISSLNVQGFSQYNLFFEALKPADNTVGGKMYIDNIKVVYF